MCQMKKELEGMSLWWEQLEKNSTKKRNHAEHKNENDNINPIKARQVFFFKGPGLKRMP